MGAKYPTLRLRLQERTPCGNKVEPVMLIRPLPPDVCDSATHAREFICPARC
jgi:hypothetical protein